MWEIYFNKKKSQWEEQCKEEETRKHREEQARLERIALEQENKRLRDSLEQQKVYQAQSEKEVQEAQSKKRDTTKMKDLVAELSAIKGKYTFRSAKNKERFAQVQQAIDEIIASLS
jgi:hypothetical protein